MDIWDFLHIFAAPIQHRTIIMANNTTNNLRQEGTLSYNETALKQFMAKLNIARTTLSRKLGLTNNQTVDRWLEGRSIYSHHLLSICNLYRLDLLSFFTYQGHTFKTRLLDLYKFETAGYSMQQVLIANNITPCEDTECHTLTYDADNPDGTSTLLANTPPDVIDRIVNLQVKAYEHERKSLEEQRQLMQSIIDDRDHQIEELKKEIKALKKTQAPTPQPYAQFVADTSKPNE